MDARWNFRCVAVAALLAMGAGYRTENFVVRAPTGEIAQQVGQAAERYRKELAVRWLGREMPRWSRPCPINVKVGDLGAGGTTTFACSHGEVYRWNMVVQGTLRRILDSVLPHEVNHTVLASHFRKPLVRWADEGAATLVEDEIEHQRQQHVLRSLLSRRRIFPLRKLLSMTQYPNDMAALYSQGYSLTRYLVGLGGHAKFLEFLGDGQQRGWEDAVRRHYGADGVEQLERQWLVWIRNGDSPDGVTVSPSTALASAQRRRPEPNIVFRGQSPESHSDGAVQWQGPPDSSPGWGTHERSLGVLSDGAATAGSLSPNTASIAQASLTGDGLHDNDGGWKVRGGGNREPAKRPSGWNDPRRRVAQSADRFATPALGGSPAQQVEAPRGTPAFGGQGSASVEDAVTTGIEREAPQQVGIGAITPTPALAQEIYSSGQGVQRPRRAARAVPARRRVIRRTIVSMPYVSGST